MTSDQLCIRLLEVLRKAGLQEEFERGAEDLGRVHCRRDRALPERTLKKHSIEEPYLRGWTAELQRMSEDREKRFQQQKKAVEEYNNLHPHGPYGPKRGS